MAEGNQQGLRPDLEAGNFVAHEVRSSVVNDIPTAELLDRVVQDVKALGVFNGISKALEDPTNSFGGIDQSQVALDLQVARERLDATLAEAVDRVSNVSAGSFVNSVSSRTQ